jgi:NAD(P)-dependent dehydrogenase (short-subunit alcohol dehydrogenase family)
MTNALRLELAPKNIRATALYVAYMDTGMLKGFDVPKLDPRTSHHSPSTAWPQTNTRSSPTTSADRYRPTSPTASQPSTPTSRRSRPDPRQLR